MSNKNKFNKVLWELGRKIEDTSLPILNKQFDCNFERNENDIFDILDFKDDDKKKIHHSSVNLQGLIVSVII